jgi:membrane complex biogenesis BtpA family protein
MPHTTTKFDRSLTLIGMVHVHALPGTPGFRGSLQQIVDAAIADAMTLKAVGFDAIVLENMHDVPYLKRDVGPEIIASMTHVSCAVADAADLPMGIQILAGANMAALAVAQACGASFIRAEGFSYVAVADEGMMDADAGPLLRYRTAIGATSIAVLADIRKKHSAHALTSDLTLGQIAHGTAFMGADGLVVTGETTGASASHDDLAEVRNATDLPVVVGSGVTAHSVSADLAHADCAIIGSDIKVDGQWRNPVDSARAAAVVSAAAVKQ